jgi:hypothetical protein
MNNPWGAGSGDEKRTLKMLNEAIYPVYTRAKTALYFFEEF